MGMSLQDMENIEIGQFVNKLNGFYERERAKQKAEWERTNFKIYSDLLQNPYIDKKDKPDSFESYMKGITKPKPTITSKKQLGKLIGIDLEKE